MLARVKEVVFGVSLVLGVGEQEGWRQAGQAQRFAKCDMGWAGYCACLFFLVLMDGVICW